MRSVIVRGNGIAARCCARLLEEGNLDVALEPSSRGRIPAVLIGAATQKLFRDVFGSDDLFDGLPSISGRVVAWGPDASARRLPHSAVVVAEQELMDRLGGRFASPDTAAWTVFASRPLPPGVDEYRFGNRTARAVAVELRDGADASSCWIESLESGWLFLIPGAAARGWLLAVGEAGDEPLSRSRLIARQVAEVAGERAMFPCDPRMAWPLCGDGWLACGTAALSFDPICGDGIGNAIREGILAAAVLRAIRRGEDPGALLEHYTSRLLAGFTRHLELSLEFYRSGGTGSWWREQSEALRKGIAWGQSQGMERNRRYSLRGFDLERLAK
jgi:hypothetical protein